MNRAPTKKEVRDRLYKILSEQQTYKFWEPKLYAHSNDGADLLLYDELYFDSLDAIEFIISINNEFEIQINDTIFNPDITLSILIDHIYDILNKQAYD